MAYIDLDYYKNTYKGADPDDDMELQKLIDRSIDIVDMITRNRIEDFDNLNALIQAPIQKATAAQTEFLVLNGENYNDSGDIKTAKVGSFSYSGDMSKQSNSMRDSIAPMIYTYLHKTGYIYGGVANC